MVKSLGFRALGVWGVRFTYIGVEGLGSSCFRFQVSSLSAGDLIALGLKFRVHRGLMGIGFKVRV